MIRSVGAGGTGLNGLPQRKPQQPETPFPKIGKGSTVAGGGTATATESKPIMVGVKPKSHLVSILEEISGVVRKNADGDKLEVSGKAILMAKKLFAQQ